MSKQKKTQRSKKLSTDLISNAQFQINANDRVLYLIFNSIGSKIKLLLNSGSNLDGILQNIDPTTYDIVLDVDGITNLVKFEEVVDFELFNIDLTTKFQQPPTSKFKTDVDISNNTTQRRSEMEKWVAEPNSATSLSLEGLTLNNGSTNWDQFEVNEQKFGIKSEFDEDLYTTRINKNDPNYLKNLEIATKLANEIENQSFNGNVHLAEERNLKFDDSGIDEEDKYSGVDRTGGSNTATNISKGDALFNSLINKEKKAFTLNESTKSTKYVPPSQRDRLQNIDSSIISAQKPNEVTSSSSSSSQQSNNHQKAPKSLETQPVEIKKPTEKASKREKHSLNFNSRSELNSLKEFSENFKIPTKFPADLLPIVTKDKIKQEEIIKKNETPETSKSTSTVSTKASSATEINSATATATTTATAASTPVTKASVPASKAEVTKQKSTETKPAPTSTPSTASNTQPDEKKNFKLNPKAASFTPSAIGSPLSGISSPSFQRNSPRITKRHIQPTLFFPLAKLPNPEKQKGFGEDFNFFKGCLNEYKKKQIESPFRLEKPFTTPPTWSIQTDDEIRSYKSLFPDIKLPIAPPPMPNNQIPSPYQQQIYPMQQQRFISPMQHPQQFMYQQNMNQFQPMSMMQQPMPPNQQGGAGGPFIPMNDFYNQQRMNHNSRFNNQNNFIPGVFNNHGPQNHGRIQGYKNH